MSSANPLRPMTTVLWCKLRRDLAGKEQQGRTSKLLPNKIVRRQEELLPSRMPVPSEYCKALMMLHVVSTEVGDPPRDLSEGGGAPSLGKQTTRLLRLHKFTMHDMCCG